MQSHTSNPLIGKTALVTGASGEIGRAVAIELARCGAKLILHYRSSIEPIQKLEREIRALRCESIAIQADLISHEAQDQLADEAIAASRKLGGDGIDILIHCAGVDILTDSSITDKSYDQKLETLLAVDSVATIRLSRRIGFMMKQRGRGSIVTIGWDGAERGMAGDSAELFSAAKGAVMAFTRSLAQSLAPQVRVNCISPGWIQTAWGRNASDYWQQRACRDSLMNRWGQPDDIAKAARFLASSDASFISGQILDVNGGYRTTEPNGDWQ